MTLRASDFDYDLPAKLIAQEPCSPRDNSRLMCFRRSDRRATHAVFRQLPQLLRPGDLLVINDTQVIPAKFYCRRLTGARIEGLFLREIETGRWEVMLKDASKCKIGEVLELVGSDGVELRPAEKLSGGRWVAEIVPSTEAMAILSTVGRTPLPPYIGRSDENLDRSDQQAYQTVYAARPGAVAAPTAGLHFTDQVLAELGDRGMETVTVTLHVGLGTFSPVRQQDLTTHRMHSEWFELSETAARKVCAAREDGRRVVAVGTTSVRVLESAASAGAGGLAPGSGWTDIFIYPPAEFRVTDALITNFHLPRSTLLMLVAAFCSPQAEDGLDMMLDCYREAVQQEYRFYSYGDAMLIE